MMKRFFPQKYMQSVFEIDYRELFDKGYRFIIFDIDNTLSPFDVKTPPLSVIKLMRRLKKIGFSVCLFSNNNEERVKKYNETLNLPAVHKAGKPKKTGVIKSLELMKATKTDFDKTVLIGDQMFTDVWCGNRMGFYTILVKPISKRDEWTVKIKRLPEKLVFNAYIKARNNNEKSKNK